MKKLRVLLLALSLGLTPALTWAAGWLPLVKSGGGACCLLDSLASPVQAAYSFRKLRSAYAGSAIRVVRASDSTQQNIGFVSNLFDTASYNTFCTATTCTLLTWFDQSGNGHDASAIGSVTPPISLTAIGSAPGIVQSTNEGFGTSTFSMTASWTAAALAVCSTPSGTTQIIFNGDNGTSGREGQFLRFNGTATFESVAFNTAIGVFVATQTVTETSPSVWSSVRDAIGQTVTNWVNSTASSPITTTGTPQSTSASISIGAFADGNTILVGNISEVILLGAASTSDRALIVTSERAYAGI